MSTRPIDPSLEYVLLGSNGASAVVDGGEKFWSQPPEQLEKFGRGWLVSEYACEKDWPNWEMHPEADELVYVLDGDIELLLEKPVGVETVRVQGRGLVIVHRGTWHTLRVRAPSRLLHVTKGAGTRHRPLAAEEPATSGYELAQLNVARMRGGKDSPVMKDFVAAIDRINGLADAAPGFVWRLRGGEGDTTLAALERENVLVTLSVWRDVASLRDYVYESAHLEVLRRRREWFESLGEASIVLWWVPVGHRPTVEEALARLERLRRAGPGPEAFDFRYPHPAPDARAG